MLKLDVLISVYGQGISNVESVILPFNENIKYIICHQAYKDIKIPDLNREDIKYIPSDTVGLSKSRNICLSNSTSDIVIFADDDVSYVDDFYEKILNAFSANPDMTGFFFKIKTRDGEPDFKSYPNEKLLVKSIFKYSPSSIEIVINKNRITNTVYFDERFGLGTEYPLGEEKIFVNDLLSQGGEFLFVNEYLVLHPYESSGKAVIHKPSLIKATSAYYCRLRGCIISIPFIVRNIMKNGIKSEVGFLNYFKFMIKGYFGYLFKRV